MAQERIDEIVIDSAFQLEAAINSLRFYYGLARHKKTPMTFELWAEPGVIVPPKLVVPVKEKVLVAGESSWNN